MAGIAKRTGVPKVWIYVSVALLLRSTIVKEDITPSSVLGLLVIVAGVFIQLKDKKTGVKPNNGR